jgi:hypothetical protein
MKITKKNKKRVGIGRWMRKSNRGDECDQSVLYIHLEIASLSPSHIVQLMCVNKICGKH